MSKKPIWGNFGPYQSKFGKKMSFPRKKRSVSFKHSNYLPTGKKSEKTEDSLQRKMPSWQAGRQTDNRDFLRSMRVQ